MKPFLVVTCLILTFAPAHAQAPDFANAKLACTLAWDVDWVTSVAFVGPRRVAAANNLGHILMWDLPQQPDPKAPPLPFRSLAGHTNTVTRLLATPDGKWLLSSSYDHSIRYWDLHAKDLKKDKVVLNARAVELAAEKKKKGPAPIEASVETQAASKVLADKTGHADWVVGMSLSRDGKLLASGDEKGAVLIWDVAQAKEQKRWQVKGWVAALAISPAGDAVLASERVPLIFDSGRHTGLKLWDAAKGEMKADLQKTFEKGNPPILAAAAYSPDGKYLAVARAGEIDGTNGKVALLDPATGKLLKEFTPGHLNGATDLCFHPDGKHLFSSGRDTVVRVWDLGTGKQVKELGQGRGGQFKDWIHALAISPDGQYLAAADMAGAVQVWGLGAK